MPNFTNAKIEQARSLADEYIRMGGQSPANWEQYAAFGSKQKMLFMIELKTGRATKTVIERVDADQRVTANENNPDILLYWLTLNLPVRLAAVREKVGVYVASYGRAKYVIPMYRLLAAQDKEYGRELFKKIGSNYNPKVAESINSLLK